IFVSKKLPVMSSDRHAPRPLTPEIIASPITGRITDSTGAPLAGATVSILSKKRTVTTDSEGRFTLDAAPGDVLTVSYIGFESITYRVSESTRIVNLTLIPSAASLGDVEVMVNTGYQ